MNCNDIDLTLLSEEEIWGEVSPVVWLVDRNTQTLISKYGLLSGIKYDKEHCYVDFTDTKMKKYLDTYMLPELL